MIFAWKVTHSLVNLQFWANPLVHNWSFVRSLHQNDGIIVLFNLRHNRGPHRKMKLLPPQLQNTKETMRGLTPMRPVEMELGARVAFAANHFLANCMMKQAVYCASITFLLEHGYPRLTLAMIASTKGVIFWTHSIPSSVDTWQPCWWGGRQGFFQRVKGGSRGMRDVRRWKIFTWTMWGWCLYRRETCFM